MPYVHSLFALALFALQGASTRTAEPRPKVVVLAIDLNNIHKSAPDAALAGRISRLADALLQLPEEAVLRRGGPGCGQPRAGEERPQRFR